MNDQPPPPDTPVHVSARQLIPAEPEAVRQALAFALRYRGRKRTDTASEAMAEITAERLVEHLAQSGYVIMHRQTEIGPDMHYGPSAARVIRGE